MSMNFVQYPWTPHTGPTHYPKPTQLPYTPNTRVFLSVRSGSDVALTNAADITWEASLIYYPKVICWGDTAGQTNYTHLLLG